MFTTGQFTKKVGIGTNTMIRWLKEGVVTPEPSKDRNNKFSIEELMIGRAIAPLYLDWNLKTKILSDIAASLRDDLRIRKILGYQTPDDLFRDASLSAWYSSYLKFIEEDPEGQTPTAEGIEKKKNETKAYLLKVGIEPPHDFFERDYRISAFTEYFHEINTYFGFMRAVISGFGRELRVAQQSDGKWIYQVGDPEILSKTFKPDSASFVVIDLEKALAD